MDKPISSGIEHNPEHKPVTNDPYSQPPPYGLAQPYVQESPYNQALPYTQAPPPPYGQAPPYSQPPPYSQGPGYQTGDKPGYQPYPYPPQAYPNMNNSGSQPTYFSQAVYPPQGIDSTQIIPVNQIVVVSNVVTNTNLSHSELRLINLAKRAKIAIFINFIIDILLTSANGGFIVVTLFNVIGLLSTKRFNRCLGVTYAVFINLVMILRIVIMIVVPIPIVIILYGITLISNIITFVIFIIFLRKMYRSNDTELYNCRMFNSSMNYVWYRRICC